jgi:hypothetical protein
MRCAIAAACVLFEGCSVVHVHTHGSDDIAVTRGFGTVNVSANPSLGPILLDARSVGFSRVQGTVVLGYRGDTLVSIPPDSCRIVFWIETPEAAAAVKTVLADAGPEICSINLPLAKVKQ